MKTLTTVLESAVTPLYETILADFDELISNSDPKKEIVQFLKQTIDEWDKIKISSKPNKDGHYEVSSRGNINFYDRDASKLTNGLFIWTQIKGNFDCSYCTSLESLEGGPREVKGFFNCKHCEKLITLEGAPKIIGSVFDCSWCKSLLSLKGAPKIIGSDFDCSWCKSLLSLEGAPEIIPEDFDCTYCESLRTLKHGPKEVKGNYFCAMCGKAFTKSEIFNNTDVQGRIDVRGETTV